MIALAGIFLSFVFPGTPGLGAAGRFVAADDPAFAYFGRFDLSDPASPAYTWPAVYVKFKVTGTRTLKVRFDDRDNVFKVYVDGKFVREYRSGSPELVARKLDPKTAHEVVLFKRTESAWSEGRFKGVEIDAKGSVLPAPARPRKIEFCGDSFTAGYGDLSPTKDCDNKTVFETTDTSFSWANLVADRLDAERMINAWSGKGFVANYGDGPSSLTDPYPAVYQRTLQTRQDSAWDFARFVPDVVVIFLGLNDFSTKEDPTPAEYKAAYLRHVDLLRQKYGPAVKFLCCGFPGDGIDANVKAFVDSQVAAGKKDIGYALMPSVSDLGCHWHPAVKGQEKMADAITPVLAAFMGW
jgi:lysophospholipase L1-like esterase